MSSPSKTAASAPTPALRAVIYARVSTTEQAQEDKASIPAQIQAARETASQHDWVIANPPFVDAGISGQKFEERKGLQRMLHDAHQGRFDLLIIYDNDRLSRKGLVGALVYDSLDQAGVQVYSIHQPIEPQPPGKYDPEEDDTGLINRSIGNLSSELYLRGFRRRSQMGKVRRVQEGFMVCNPPYGYQVEYRRGATGSIEKHRIPHPEQAPFVRRIFESCRQGLSTHKIAHQLNAQSIPSKQGKLWKFSTVKSILKNPFYYGEVIYGKSRMRNGKRVSQEESQWLRAPGKHTPLISRETFEEVQRILQSRAPQGRAVGSPGLLAGLLKCGYCGRAMSKEGSGRKDGGYFVCGKYHQTGCCQRNGKNRIPHVEETVLGHIQQLRQNPRLLQKIRQQRRKHQHRSREQELASHRRERDKLASREENLVIALERGFLAPEKFAQRQRALEEEGQRLHQIIHQMEQQLSQQQQRHQAFDAAREALRTFDSHFEDLPRPLQKQLLRNLIEKIVIQEREIRIHYRLF